MDFLIFIQLFFWVLIIFATFKLKPRTQKILGKAIIILYIILLIFSIITAIRCNELLNAPLNLFENSVLVFMNNSYLNFIRHLLDFDTVYIICCIIGIVWGFILFKHGKANSNQPNTKNLGSVSYTVHGDNHPSITGKDLAIQINALYESFTSNSISEEDLLSQKFEVISSLLDFKISEPPEDFINELNLYVQKERVDSDELNGILNICTIKKKISILDDESLIETLNTHNTLDPITLKATKCELSTRGYSKKSIDEFMS